MMDESWFKKSEDVAWLKELYFKEEAKSIFLTKGEVLLTPDSFNDRLFIIWEGELTGYIYDEYGGSFEIFKSYKDMFVGVYSFFSSTHQSYSKVVASKDTTVRFIDRSQPEVSVPQFAQHFLPVVVNEIYLRQLLAQKISMEKQAMLKKLALSEKMSTLGQLASGIAHELNNAIGIIQQNTDWLAHNLKEYIKKKDQPFFSFFTKSFKNGHQVSSSLVRERRKEIERKFSLSTRLSKQLAKSSIDDDQIKILIDNGLNEFKSIRFMIETGLALHDLKLAAKQSSRVVRSIRELGSTSKIEMINTGLSETVKEALTLTKKMLSNVKLSLIYETNGRILANPGDLVQVWINLIKNATESLAIHKTIDPEIEVKTWEDELNYFVSIRDNGVGIPPELLPKIFQPNVTTKVSGLSFGLGLGLSILKKVVESYQGSVSVTSVPQNTCFVVQLPKNA